jgi:predicted RNase H-like HicB family nuclease
MPAYLALLRKDPDSDYGIELPDFPGCVTAAEDMAQARELVEEALLFHIEGLLADGEPLPKPSNFEKIMADPETAKRPCSSSRSPTRICGNRPETRLSPFCHVLAEGLSARGYLIESMP